MKGSETMNYDLTKTTGGKFFNEEIDVVLESFENKLRVSKEQRAKIINNMFDNDYFWEELFVDIRDRIEDVTGQELD